MWIRDFEVRREELKTYNPYRSDIFVDPIVVRNLQHKVQFKKVNYVDHKWQSAVISALHDNGSVDPVVAKQDVHKFQSELFMLLATPIDVDALQFYPSIDSVDSLVTMWRFQSFCGSKYHELSRKGFAWTRSKSCNF